MEAALQRFFLPPDIELLLDCYRRALLCGFVDQGDRFLQTSRPIVQVAEPQRCRQIVRIESQCALEPRLRQVVSPSMKAATPAPKQRLASPG